MHTLTLFGTPEDRIRIEGEFQAEMDVYDLEDGAFLAINDGTLLTIDRDSEGIWKLNAVTVGAASSLERTEGAMDSGPESDQVTLNNPDRAFRWALLGSDLSGPLEWPESDAR